jgi:tetratricopeptide (TPR) repeat protein
MSHRRRGPGSNGKLRSAWGIVAFALLAVSAGFDHAGAADGRSATGLSKSLATEESRSGAASPHLLPLLDRLAGVQFGDGALDEAASSRRRALKIALRAYGGNSTNAANAMIALADVEILRHHYTEAEPLLTAAVLVLETRVGPDNAALAAPVTALARIALARGDVRAAEASANRANAIAARRASAASSEPMRVLGAVYAEQRRFDDGERVLRAVLARDRVSHGPASLDTARSLAQLANLLLRAERFGEALPLIEEAVAIDQERLGPTHPLIADDFADLGLIYAGLGRDDDASAALYFAIDVLNRGAGEETPRVAYAELELAAVLRRLGETEDADAAFHDAKRILDDAADNERQHERQI